MGVRSSKPVRLPEPTVWHSPSPKKKEKRVRFPEIPHVKLRYDPDAILNPTTDEYDSDGFLIRGLAFYGDNDPP